MSKITKVVTERDLANHVMTDDGKEYYIDSAWTSDHGFETMVFEIKNGEIDWKGVYVETYGGKLPMVRKHNKLCKHLEDYL